jgi:hypothetical protein
MNMYIHTGLHERRRERRNGERLVARPLYMGCSLRRREANERDHPTLMSSKTSGASRECRADVAGFPQQARKTSNAEREIARFNKFAVDLVTSRSVAIRAEYDASRVLVGVYLSRASLAFVSWFLAFRARSRDHRLAR